MTKFRKTILGKILGGAGKALKVGAGAALSFVPGGAAVEKVASKVGLFKKIGKIFKKKTGTLITGGTAIQAGVKAASESIGSTTHAILDDVSAQNEGGESSEFSKGFKKGFLKDLWEKNKGVVIAVGVFVLAIIGFLIFKGKRHGRRS